MTLKWKIMKNILFSSTLLFLLILSGCASESQYIFYNKAVSEQLKERALRHCHGDFKVLQEEDFGPYTRARLECRE
jgi:hypothetical protein